MVALFHILFTNVFVTDFKRLRETCFVFWFLFCLGVCHLLPDLRSCSWLTAYLLVGRPFLKSPIKHSAWMASVDLLTLRPYSPLNHGVVPAAVTACKLLNQFHLPQRDLSTLSRCLSQWDLHRGGLQLFSFSTCPDYCLRLMSCFFTALNLISWKRCGSAFFSYCLVFSTGLTWDGKRCSPKAPAARIKTRRGLARPLLH